MRVSEVQFINVVSFAGQIKSCNGRVVGDRPGQVPTEIEVDEKMRFFKLSRIIDGKPRVKYVPMSNVSGFEVVEEVEAPKVAPKK